MERKTNEEEIEVKIEGFFSKNKEEHFKRMFIIFAIISLILVVILFIQVNKYNKLVEYYIECDEERTGDIYDFRKEGTGNYKFSGQNGNGEEQFKDIQPTMPEV